MIVLRNDIMLASKDNAGDFGRENVYEWLV